MKTTVAIPHHDLPSDHRDLAQQRVQQLERIGDELHGLHVVLELDHLNHHVEIVANIDHGQTLVSEGREESFHAALDAACARMETQLRRHHERLVDRRHGKG